MERKAYPSDVSDAECALVAPYLTLMIEGAPQRDYPLREVFNGFRWIVRRVLLQKTSGLWSRLVDFPTQLIPGVYCGRIRSIQMGATRSRNLNCDA